MRLNNRKAILPAVLLAILSGCGSPKPTGKAGKEISAAQQALASAKGYVEQGEFDKAAVEYSRASEIAAKGKALATTAETPKLDALEQEAQGGIAEAQSKKAAKEKADEEARKKEEQANRFKRWRTRITIPAAVDYLDVLPGNLAIAGQLKNLGASIEGAKKTALGRLLASQELAPLWQRFQAAVVERRKRAGAPARSWAELSQEAQLWLSRFQGQFAAALWKIDFQNPAGMGAAMVAEITDPIPEAVLDELIEKTGVLPPAGPTTITYKDVDIWMPAPGGPAMTLLGRHLVVGPNPESVKAIVDGFIKPAGFGTSANCAAARASLGQKPEAFVFFDFEAYMREVGKMMAMAGGGAGAQDAFQKMMKSSGADAMKLMAMSSACVGDSFEERAVAIFEGDPKGFNAMSLIPPDAPPPLKALAFVPANSVVAAAGYLDAQQLPAALKEYLSSLNTFFKAAQAGAPPRPGMPAPPDFEAVLQAFQDKAGIKLDEIAAGLKGETGFYVALGPGLVAQPPDIGMFLTCTSPEKAKAFCDAISKSLGAYFTPSPVKELPRPERTIYQLDLVALGQTLGAAVPPRIPYTPSWAVQGNRFCLASSPQALSKQLSYLDSKTDAGLLTQPDFVKALSRLTAEERKGPIMYVDMKSLLSAAAMLGLPLLQVQIQDPELKQILQNLPAPQVLFKEIPPMIAASVPSPARPQLKNKAGELVEGRKVESVLRGPVPPLESVFLLSVGVGVAAARFQMQMQRPPVSVPPPKPPGQF